MKNRPNNAQPAFDAARLNTAPIERVGGKVAKDGSIILSPEAQERLRTEMMRRAAVSNVPSAPKNLPREGSGLAIRKGASTSPFGYISFDQLRTVRERAIILQVIHSARHYQIQRMAAQWTGELGKVGWRVVHRDFTAHNAKPPKDIEPFIKRATRILECPSPTYRTNTMASLLTPLWEDMATINRPVVEIIHSLEFPDNIAQVRWVDGAIIWSTISYLEKWCKDNPGYAPKWDSDALTPEQYLRRLAEHFREEIGGSDFVLVRDGVLEATYRPGQLLVAPRQTRTDIRWAGYPPGHVEQALELAANFINASEYNASLFTRGSFAEYILYVTGALGANLDAFRDNYREATQGVGRAHQPPILELEEGQVGKIDLKGTPRDMGFENWHSFLAAASCAVYRMDPSTVNMKPWDSGGRAPLSEGNREQEIALAKEEGLQGDLEHLRLEMLNPIVRRIHPDLCVLLEYGDFDPQKAAQIYEQAIRTDMTPNEVRLEKGRRPLGFWLSDEDYEKASDEEKDKHDANPYNNIANQTIIGALAMQRQTAGFGSGQGYMDDEAAEYPQPPPEEPEEPNNEEGPDVP